MKWLLIIFILTWLFCSACETTYNKAHDKVEEVAKKTYENNKDTIKKKFYEYIGWYENCFTYTWIWLA